MLERRVWIAAATVAALAVAGWWGWHTHAVRGRRQAVQAAAAHLEAGRVATARRQLLDLARRWPDDDEVLYRLGLCERARDDRKAAIGCWEKIHSRSPWFARAAAAQGMSLVDMGRYDDAESILGVGKTKARTVEDHREVDRATLRLLRFQGRIGRIRRLLRETAATAKEPWEVLKELWLLDTSPFPLEAWKYALDHAAKDDPRVWLGQAHVAILTARYDDARAWIDRCLERNADDEAAWEASLELARAEDDATAARRALPHLAPDPDPAEALELRAWLHGKENRPAEERADLQRLTELEPWRAGAWDRLSALSAREGKSAEAAALQKQKGTVDQARSRYRAMLLSGDGFQKSAADLAALCRTMGRGFDAAAWESIVAGKAPSVEAAEMLWESEGLAQIPVAAQLPPPAGASSRLAGSAAQVPEPTPTLRRFSVSAKSPATPRVAPRFEDAAAAAGLAFTYDNGSTPNRLLPETMSGGVALLDFNGDHRLDVFVVQGGPIGGSSERPTDRLFRNMGGGKFEDATESSGISNLPRGYGLGVAVGDYDNDGDPDLFLSRLTGYALWRNDGGRFADATATAGLDGRRDNPTSAGFGDLDNDGDLDLYVCHYMIWDEEHPKTCQDENGKFFYCDPRVIQPAPDRVFRNDDGVFHDVTAEAGFTDPDGRGLGVVIADLDDDGLADVFVANDGTANYLFRNLGGFRFEEVGVSAGVASNAEGGFQASMGVACGDVDGDLRPDLLVTNFYGEGTTIYTNLGGGQFHDTSSSSGLFAATRHLLGFGLGLIDHDDDGDLDVISANGHVNDNRPYYPYAMPAQLLENTGEGKLRDVSRLAGDCWQVPRVGRGLTLGDVDGDGRVDAVLLSQNEPIALFHNRTDGGHHLNLILRGTRSNRDGVGAVVTLTSGGRPHRAFRIGGGSYQSANAGTLHFGLGDSTSVEEVEVRWPSGQVEVHRGLAVDHDYLIVEGESAARPLP